MKRKSYKLKEEVREAVLSSLRNGETLIKACELANVNRQSIYNLMSVDKKFAEQVEKAKLARVQVAEDALYNLMIKGNITAIIFFLCNRAPEKWKNVNKVDIEGKLQLPKPIVIEPAIKEQKNEPLLENRKEKN